MQRRKPLKSKSIISNQEIKPVPQIGQVRVFWLELTTTTKSERYWVNIKVINRDFGTIEKATTIQKCLKNNPKVLTVQLSFNTGTICTIT